MKEKYYGIIYKVTNIVNGKIYIGQTITTLANRKRCHINSSKLANCSCYFHKALKKYGEKNFIWEVLDHCNSKKELNEMEFHYIKQYNSFGVTGYNLTFGGEGSIGYKHSSINRAKMSDASFRSDNHVNRGKPLSEEWRKRISEAQKGKVISEETRRKISASKKGMLVGKDSHFSKKFVITSPTKEEFYVIGLTHFCRNFTVEKLDHRLLHAVAKGGRAHHKGYTCRYYDGLRDNNIKIYDGEYYENSN